MSTIHLDHIHPSVFLPATSRPLLCHLYNSLSLISDDYNMHGHGTMHRSIHNQPVGVDTKTHTLPPQPVGVQDLEQPRRWASGHACERLTGLG